MPGGRLASQLAGEGMAAARVREACTDQCCRHIFLGGRNAHSVLSQGKKGNKQQQKGGSSLTLPFLAASKANICVLFVPTGDAKTWWSFRRCVPLRWSRLCCFNMSVTEGLVEEDAARSDLLWAGHLRAAWALSAPYNAIKLLSSFKHGKRSHDYLTCGLPLPAIIVLLGICQLPC